MTMNEMDHSPTCERAGDLVSVLYGEAGERERRDFELHMKQCGSCRAEFTAFAEVRESIGEWRDEALTGFVSAHSAPPVRKSALAAMRQFFGLSPLWLKGAVGFAGLVFCALVALVVLRSGPTDKPAQVAGTNPEGVYTKQDIDRAVQEALAKQQREQHIDEPKLATVSESPNPKSTNFVKSGPRARRPFSRAEREQLAADLRLLSIDDEADLEQLDDRINRQR
jgi:putative zinc finger protein